MSNPVSQAVAADIAATRASADKPSKVAPLLAGLHSLGLGVFSLFGLTDRDPVASETPDHISILTKKRMRRDAQIRLGMKALKAPLRQVDRFYVESDKPEMSDLVETVFRPLLPELLRICCNALDFGFQAAEIQWSVQNVRVHEGARRGANPKSGGASSVKTYSGLYVPVCFRDIDPEQVDIQVTKRGEYAGIKIGNVKLSPGQTMLATYQREFGNLYGESYLDAAHTPYQYASIIRKLWGRFLEKFAMGTFVGKAPPEEIADAAGNRQNPVEWLNTVLLNARGGGAVTLPAQYDQNGNAMWDATLSESSREGRAFAEAIQFFEALKLRAILVPERVLTQDVLTGSHSMAESHAEIFFTILDQITDEVILDPINSQLVRPFLELNFGPEAVSGTRFLARQVSREVRSLLFRIVEKALDIPVRMQDGRQYSLAALIDPINVLEQLSIPHRTLDEAAVEPVELPFGDEDDDAEGMGEGSERAAGRAGEGSGGSSSEAGPGAEA